MTGSFFILYNLVLRLSGGSEAIAQPTPAAADDLYIFKNFNLQ